MMGGKLDHLNVGQREMKAQIKDLDNKIERLGNRMDKKLDCMMYNFFLGALQCVEMRFRFIYAGKERA